MLKIKAVETEKIIRRLTCTKIPISQKEKHYTAQKAKFSIKDFFSKCDQIRRKLRIWSHLLQKSLMENFIFCVSERGNPSLNIREGACYQGFTNVVIRDFATRIRER